MPISRQSPAMDLTPRAAVAGIRRAALEQLRRYGRAFRQCRQHSSARPVHHLRIAARRLLASLELLRPVVPTRRHRAARQALKRQLKASSSLRDAHVQLQCVEELLPQYPRLAKFRDHLRRRRRRLSRELGHHLRKAKMTRGARDVGRALRPRPNPPRDEPLEAIRQATGRRARRMTRLLAQSSVSPAHLHQARIAVKKFRYLAESVPPQPGWPLPATVHECQRRLGEIRDLSLLQARLDRFSRKHGLDRRESAAIRRGWARRRRALRQACRSIASTIAARHQA